MGELKPLNYYSALLRKELPKEIFKRRKSPLIKGAVYLLVIFFLSYLIVTKELPLVVELGFSLVVGASYGAVGLLAHEILHGSVIKNRKIKNILGSVGFFIFSISHVTWKKWHNEEHHRNTQNREVDPDAWPSFEDIDKEGVLIKLYNLPKWMRVIGEIGYLFLEFSIHGFRKYLHYKNEFKKEDYKVAKFLTYGAFAFWGGLLFLVGFKSWVLLYIIPLLIANGLVMSYITTNHRLNPVTNINDPIVNSLSLRVPKVFDFLHFNFSHHTEHHLFPGVSSEYYPLIKKVLKERFGEKYNEMTHFKALFTLWKTPRVYFEENYLFNPRSLEKIPCLGVEKR